MIFFKAEPCAYNHLTKFCSNVGTWMKWTAAEESYDYSDDNSFSKVMLCFLKSFETYHSLVEMDWNRSSGPMEHPHL